MLSTFFNSFRILELRQRLLLTLGLVFIARLGSVLPLPGINTPALQLFFDSQDDLDSKNILGFYNIFTGGALSKGAIFGLGIMPYISSSIVIQILIPIIPFLAKLQQEGDIGVQKITQYTRYLTLVICVLQSILLINVLRSSPSILIPGYDVNVFGSIIVKDSIQFALCSTIFLTAGTMLLMWLGEQISQNGIGNGISILITIGILADLPQTIIQSYYFFTNPSKFTGLHFGLLYGIFTLILFYSVIIVMVSVSQATRNIPVQYSKSTMCRKIYGNQDSFLPLKLNYTGVMPVIFASTAIAFPQQILSWTEVWLVNNCNNPDKCLSRILRTISSSIRHGTYMYYSIYGLLIVSFSYLWVYIMFKPNQIADDIKKNGGYILGVRPGKDTAIFLSFIMLRLTLLGSFFLLVVATLPDFLYKIFEIPSNISLLFGGTGTLISVGVILDTVRQIETYLLQQHYDDFFKKKKVCNQGIMGFGLNIEDNFKSISMANVFRLIMILFLVLGIIGLVAFFVRKL